MWKFITKNEFFSILHAKDGPPDEPHLKFVQDAWFHKLFKTEGAGTVLEMGGGATRTLQPLVKRGFECWNADRFEGAADGPLMDSRPVQLQLAAGIKIAPCYLGDFSTDLKDDYFDIVYSISVMEHLKLDEATACFKDAMRVLKPGGRIYHAVDLFLDAKPLAQTNASLEVLRTAIDTSGLQPLGEDQVDPAPIFKTSFASGGDVYLARRWCLNPGLQKMVENFQITSLIMGHQKPAK